MALDEQELTLHDPAAAARAVRRRGHELPQRPALRRAAQPARQAGPAAAARARAHPPTGAGGHRGARRRRLRRHPHRRRRAGLGHERGARATAADQTGADDADDEASRRSATTGSTRLPHGRAAARARPARGGVRCRGGVVRRGAGTSTGAEHQRTAPHRLVGRGRRRRRHLARRHDRTGRAACAGRARRLGVARAAHPAHVDPGIPRSRDRGARHPRSRALESRRRRAERRTAAADRRRHPRRVEFVVVVGRGVHASDRLRRARHRARGRRGPRCLARRTVPS